MRSLADRTSSIYQFFFNFFYFYYFFLLSLLVLIMYSLTYLENGTLSELFAVEQFYPIFYREIIFGASFKENSRKFFLYFSCLAQKRLQNNFSGCFAGTIKISLNQLSEIKDVQDNKDWHLSIIVLYTRSYCYIVSLKYEAWTLFLTIKLTYFAANV